VSGITIVAAIALPHLETLFWLLRRKSLLLEESRAI
jgi:hypothetical protein